MPALLAYLSLSKAMSERMKQRWARMSPDERERQRVRLAEMGRKEFKRRYPERYKAKQGK